jgi:prephenate dehydratase
MAPTVVEGTGLMSNVGVKQSVAIQGEPGAFSHQAALELLGDDVELVHCQGFDALFDAVAGGHAQRGVVPIENSLAGSIHENYDRLSRHGLHIVGEVQLRIRHCLIVGPGGDETSLRRVHSHPVALAQCRGFFAARPGVEPVAVYDTAGAVKDMIRAGDSTVGAIASCLAAELYGGRVLMEGVEDDPQNFTRFLLLSRDVDSAVAVNKTSLVFTLQNKPGALYAALGAFASRSVDLSKIESRPLRGRPWEYEFYLDVLGDPAGAAGEAMRELQAMCHEYRVLGSYVDGLRRPVI